MKNRNPILVAVLSLITLGIYMLYWLIVTKNEMNKKGAKIPTIWLALAPILALLTIAAVQIILRFITSDSSGAAGGFTTIVNIISVLVGLVSVLAVIPASIYWFYKYCKGVELVAKGSTSFNFSFWLGILLNILSVPFVWAGIMQHEFNKLGTSKSQVADTPYPKTVEPA